MFGFILLTLFFVAAITCLVLASVVVFTLKLGSWLVLWPVRLLLKLLWLPVALVGGGLALVAGAVAVPLLMVLAAGALVFGLLVAALSALLPLMPFVLLGLLVWALVRQRPATI